MTYLSTYLFVYFLLPQRYSVFSSFIYNLIKVKKSTFFFFIHLFSFVIFWNNNFNIRQILEDNCKRILETILPPNTPVWKLCAQLGPAFPLSPRSLSLLFVGRVGLSRCLFTAERGSRTERLRTELSPLKLCNQ